MHPVGGTAVRGVEGQFGSAKVDTIAKASRFHVRTVTVSGDSEVLCKRSSCSVR